MTRKQKERYGRKTFVVDVKSVKDGSDGGAPGFTGYASVFGNVDSYGDVMVKGAFAKTLAEDYGGDGAGIPCYWSHRMDDPMMNVGATVAAKEDDVGLLVEVEFGVDTAVEQQVARLVKSGRAKQMSFAFDYVEAAWVTRDGIEFYEVREVKLHEVSVVAVGANQETSILSAKAHDLAAIGRKEDPAPSDDTAADDTVTVPVDVLRALVDGLASIQEAVTTAAATVADALPEDDDDTTDESTDDESPADEELAGDPINPDDAADVDVDAEPKSAPTFAERARLLLGIDALSGAGRGQQ